MKHLLTVTTLLYCGLAQSATSGMQNENAAFAALAAANTDGATLRVANNGVDSGTCGDALHPCRSLNQAMLNAAYGDTIVVGSGLYGDLNDDGDYDDPGEEHGDEGSCIVCVVKPLKIYSVLGAQHTLIDGRHTSRQNGISIFARDVIFGSKDHGFTMLPPQNSVNGIQVNLGSTATRVGGNIVRGAGQSAFFFPTLGRAVQITDNTAIGAASEGFTGFYNQFEPGTSSTPTIVKGNTANGNIAGFNISGINVSFTDNIANANGVGFMLGGSGFVIKNNSVTGSTLYGAAVGPFDENNTAITVTELSRNTIIGSYGAGLTLYFGGIIQGFTQNTIFANGSDALLRFGEPRANCGLLNATGRRLVAANNFWGAASGPGPDPADEAARCDIRGRTTIVNPVATSPNF